MPSAARVERLHRDLLDFLLEAHERVITEQDGAAFAKRIADIRTLAERLRARYASADEKKLMRKLRDMSAAELKEVARAFTLLFWLLNLAEERHAAALRSAKESDAFRSLFERTRRAGLDARSVAERIGDLRATIVLTAHPTEALRWSLRETLDRIDDLLTRREGGKGSAAKPWKRRFWVRSPGSGSPRRFEPASPRPSTRCATRSTSFRRCSSTLFRR